MNKLEQKIDARVTPEQVWKAWEKVHDQTGIVEGKKGVVKKIRYQFLEVVPGERYTICWKTLFVRLIFTHSVVSTQRGAEITYSAKIKGLFAIPVRWMLGPKISQNLGLVLRALVRQLEAVKK